MSATLRQFLLLVGKDLRIEARGRQTIGLVLVLGLLIVIVLGLGLGATAAAAFGAPVVLWVAYLFAGVLCFEKTMAVERTDGALAGLMLAPMDRSTIYLAKLTTNLILMTAVALVITPAGVVFFSFDLSAAPGTFVLVMALGILGFAAIGTLFASLVSSTRLQGGLLAMMAFPVALPLVIASTQLMLHRFRDGQPIDAGALGILVAFDAIFLSASWLVFDWVLEP
ncbi:MAG TPA: heme exporter protein CcmB [Tepidisphaeraceae bacterium]|nr:heme exporter protein CcmB [Tepidisphaeraceae bacterium]